MDLRSCSPSSASSRERPDVRAVIWRGEGKSFSSGRDVSAIGGEQVELSHHELMSRGHRGILQLFDIEAPIIVAMQGWSIGASFQRALLCDIRIAAEGARFMLPEVTHGVIPDTGGVGAAVPDLRARRRVATSCSPAGRWRSTRPTPTASCRGSCRRRRSTRPSREMAREDRGRAGGHREDGPAGAAPPVRGRPPLVDGRGADRPDVHRQVRRHGGVPRRSRRGPRPRTSPGAETMTTELPGLPGPPALGATALPAGTFDGTAVFVTGAGTGLGKAIALGVRPARRLDRDRQPQARAPRGRPRGGGGAGRAGRRPSGATSAIPSRSRPRSTPPSRRSGCREVLINNAAANFPVPAEDMSPNAWRTRGRHHAQRHVLLRRRVRPASPRGRHAGFDRQRRRVVRVDRRPGVRAQRGGQGGREEHGRDAGGGVGRRTASR